MLKSIIIRNAKKLGEDDVVIVPQFKDGRYTPVGLDRLPRAILKEARARKHFSGKLGDTWLAAAGATTQRHVFLVGLGEKNKVTAEEIAAAGAVAARVIARRGFKSAVVALDDALCPGGPTAFLRAFVKGFDGALYAYNLGSSDATSTITRLAFAYDGERRAMTAAARDARVLCEYVSATRDLVNAPANLMTPADMAERAREMCKDAGVTCRVFDKRELEKMGMGAVLAVAQGSKQDPRFIVMQHNRTSKNLPTVCLVGKGVTFDSGGISIKPWEKMNEMKGDMAGGAVVIGTMAAAARMELPVRLIGVVPCVENMPSGVAFRPGDVITTYSGKTIEILTTDAEGRLILSDALTYAREEFNPDVIVDYATLTGAVVIALGDRIAGVMGNSQEHIDMMLRAGTDSGEPVWQLPLDDYFYEGVNGDISDYKNYSGRAGSTMTAAALLGKFAAPANWVHVDIAGTYWSDGRRLAYPQKGATGYGVDLTLAFLQKIVESS